MVSESSSTLDAFYHYDGLGSVVGLTDPAGKLLGRYVYDAWGQVDLSAPGPQLGTKNKFRFTGEALDPGTQLYYLRARYYDPSSGRFLNNDPLPITNQNRYLYALDNPVTYTDPLGLEAQSTDNSSVALWPALWPEFAALGTANLTASFLTPRKQPPSLRKVCGFYAAPYGPCIYPDAGDIKRAWELEQLVIKAIFKVFCNLEGFACFQSPQLPKAKP